MSNFFILFHRFNAQLNKELPPHASVLFFMNRLRILFFESGVNLIAQGNGGKAFQYKGTLAAQQLVDLSRDAEQLYTNGTMSAAALLRTAADHYNEEKVVDVLRIYTAEPQDTPTTESLPENLRALEDDMSIDDRMWYLTQDPDLMDIGTQSMSWTTSMWTMPETNVPEKSYNVQTDDVHDAVRVLCLVCARSTTEQMVLNCGHFFCNDCLQRDELQDCPYCRTPITTRKPLILSALSLAWREHADANFNNSKPSDPIQDATNPQLPNETPTNHLTNEPAAPLTVQEHAELLAQQLQTASRQEELLLTGQGN